MNKLFRLKKWLTLEEAARRLSSSAEEPISEADVLRLALDGELVLSVDFVNHARGKPWAKASLESARTFTYDASFFGEEGEPRQIIAGFALSEDEVLQPIDVDEPVTLRGVFDLAMWGAEALDVENLYQELTDGPPVELMNIEGAFVYRDGAFFQLLESFEDNGYRPGTLAQLAHIERRIMEESIDPGRAAEMRAQHKGSRVKYLEKVASERGSENFYPASGLPSTCRLVVRNESIRQLEDRLLGAEDTPAAKEASHSKPSQFLAISALLDLLKEPVKHPRPNGLNQSAIIEAILERFDSRGLSKRTLEDVFSAANRSRNPS